MNSLLAILALLTAAQAVFASGHPTEQLQLARAEQEEKEGRSLVQQFLLDADDVFVGRLISQRTSEHLRLDADGHEERIETTHLHFEPLDVFKGAPSPDVEYYFERRPDVIVVQGGYSSLVGTEVISFDGGLGYRFIVYALGGEIVRSNLVQDWFDGLTSEVELEIIRGEAER